MDEDELARIRQQRMAQIQADHKTSAQGLLPRPQQSGGDSSKSQKQQNEAKEREAEMRNNILSSVLTQEARARLATLASAKPERAKMVENLIIRNAQMGRVGGKVDEDSLKDLLEKVNDQTKRDTKVSYERRRVFDDDEDEDEDD